MGTILSLGDCNTLGAGELAYNSYPERIAKSLDMECVNKGHTMCTTREGVRYFNDFYNENVSLLMIQFGLVDSWNTISHAPYVLYYPDNRLRKLGRKLSKKYKKIAKRLKLRSIFGESSLVSIDEYKTNINSMIDLSKASTVFLIETVPNADVGRNDNIKAFNQVLHDVAAKHENVYVLSLFDIFNENIEALLMSDGTHINEHGYDLIRDEFLKKNPAGLIPKKVS